MSNSSKNSSRSSKSENKNNDKLKPKEELKELDESEVKKKDETSEKIKEKLNEEDKLAYFDNALKQNKEKEILNKLSNEEIIDLNQEKKKEIDSKQIFKDKEKVALFKQKIFDYLEKLKISKSQKQAARNISNFLLEKVSNSIKNNFNIQVQSIEYLLDSSHQLKIDKLLRKSTNLDNSTDKKSNQKEYKEAELKGKLEEEKLKKAIEFSKKVAKQQKEINLNKKKRDQEIIDKRKEEKKLMLEYQSMEEEDLQGHKRKLLENRINEGKVRRKKEKDAFLELKERKNLKKYNYYHEQNMIRESNSSERKEELHSVVEKHHKNIFQSYKSLKPLKNSNYNFTKKMMEKNSYQKNANSKLISLTLERVLEEDRKRKEDQKQKEEEMRLLRHKMRAYGEIIKQTYLPIASEKKASELKNYINKLKHPVMQTKEVKHNYIAHEILPKIKKEKSSKNKLSDNESSMDKIKHYNNKSKFRKLKNQKKSIDSDILKNSNEKIPKINYLEELKQQRIKVPTRMQLLDWKSDLNNEKLSIVEKFNRVSLKASQLQADAEMKEKILRNNGINKKNLNLEQEAADMYVDSIKAKLAIFEKFE